MSLSQDDVLKYKKLYVQTAKNYLENMQLNISYLLKGEQIQEAIKQVHIDAHSLKSQSQMMGYDNFSKISEIIEFLFNRDEKENIQVPNEVLIKIQSDISRLMDSLVEIENNGKEIDLADRIVELEKLK